MTNSNTPDTLTKINSLSIELSSILISNTANQRGECTRLLRQWKGLSRHLSKKECHRCCLDLKKSDEDWPMMMLFRIVEDDDGSYTEGHREMALEIVKACFDGAFFRHCDDTKEVVDDEERNEIDGSTIISNENCDTNLLTEWFCRCSITFQKRMQKNDVIGHSDFHSDDVRAGPVEPCEHIRLLLVELMLSVSNFLMEYVIHGFIDDDRVLQAASITCQALAKSALSDPYPEVQRASCSLIQTLTRVSPMAVRMNASSLLLPLAGNPESFSTLKNSLFRHRHAKTRCVAVDASNAISLCCSRTEDDADDENADDCANIANDVSTTMQQNVIAGRGSKSSSLQQHLLDTVLAGWEEIIKLDASTSVRQATLKASGKIATVLEWRYSSKSKDTDLTSFQSTMDLESIVETKVLFLFMLGLSDGNADVRALAARQLSCLDDNTSCYAPWDILARYYEPLLQFALEQCSLQMTSCQGKVRSIEALQAVLSLNVPLSTTRTEGKPIHELESLIQSSVHTLSDAILSDEKDVLDTSLKACRILGGSDDLALGVLAYVSNISFNSNTNENEGTDSSEATDEVSAAATPRRLASSLLLLDGIMKGHLSNQEVTSILREVDESVSVPAPAWFHQSESKSILCQVLASDSVLQHVTTHSSLAWALLDAISSFVNCLNQPLEEAAIKVTQNIQVGILSCITYLLACPVGFGILNHVKTVLDDLSKICSHTDEYLSSATSSMLDCQFRQIAMKISSSNPFPWTRTDPSFLAMDALLRYSKGSTVRNNFDLVAPLFLYHLPEKKDDKKMTAKEDSDEEYSLRISLMSLLQAILSDDSFSEGPSMQSKSTETDQTSSQFTSQFTFDILLSLVLPNLVWKSGGVAAALRKLSVATLLALLSHHGNHLSIMDHESYRFLLPILHSNLDDTESTTRELSCACLSLIFDRIPSVVLKELWNTDTRVIDTLHPRLLTLLDDSHDPVRLVALKTIESFLAIVLSLDHGLSDSSYLGLSSLESIVKSLVLTLDDPESSIQKQSFNVLSTLVDIAHKMHDKNVISLIEKHTVEGEKSHRDEKYCKMLQRNCVLSSL